MPFRLRLRLRTLLTVAVGVLAFAGAAVANPHSDGSPIVIPDSPGAGSVGAATPTSVVVSGEPVPVSRLRVTLTGFLHEQPDDIDVVLVGPNGQSVMLMSDAGADNAVGILRPIDGSGGTLDISFDDAAVGPVPDEGVLSEGIWQPSNYGKSTIASCGGEPATDVFPGGPAAPFGSALSVFDGLDSNGTWTLYAVDDCRGSTGMTQSGWTLDVNPAPSSVGIVRFTASSRAGRVSLTWRTASENDLVGFNVYRSAPGSSPLKLNRRLVPARKSGSTRGSAYRLTDACVRRGVSYTYRLQLVWADGARVWAGSSALRAG